MQFDPTKLPPAPFAVSPNVHDSWGWIRDAEGAPAGRTDCSWLLGDLDEFRRTHEYGSPEYKRGPEAVANLAEFCAVARNAFDVMMRRGWGVVHRQSGWFAAIPEECFQNEIAFRKMRWPDPFTALVESDKWWIENVEKGG